MRTQQREGFEVQHKGPVLSAIGVLLLVFVIGLVGGCHGIGGNETPGYQAISGTWWQVPVPTGSEYVKMVIGDGQWTVTQKPCGLPAKTYGGSWTYDDATEQYTFTEQGGPDFYAKVALGIITDHLGRTFTRTQTTQPCP